MKSVGLYCLSLCLMLPAAVYAQDEEDYEDADSVVVTHVRKTVKKQEPTRVITGRVIQSNEAPLAGVLVQSVAGEGYSTLTDEEGAFTLNVPLYSSSVNVTLPGYNSVRVGLNASGKLRDIVLHSDVARPLYTEDDNIMNVARATGFDFSNATSISTEIQSQLGAEVYTNQRSALKGVGSYMQIGGVGSYLTNAQPLVIIDGVITDMQYSREMIHSGFYNDILSNINVNDIESVEVVKNGTALYGAKGANGVIIVKTKRCSSMATRIAATANVGIELVPRQFNMLSGPQYKSYASDLLGTTGTKLQTFKFLRADDPNYFWINKYGNDTDWTDGVLHNAVSQSYGLSIQGGGEVANYMLSIGYNHATEQIEEANYNRLNVRFNTDIKITDWLNVRFDASYANTTRKLYDTGAPEDYENGTVTSLNFLAAAKSPMLSPYSFVVSDVGPGVINGNHLDIEDEDYLKEVKNEKNSRLKNSNYELANPLAILEYGTAENKNYYDSSFLNLSITPSWNPNKHLRLSSLFSYTLSNTNEKYYIPMNGVPEFYVTSLRSTKDNMIASLYSKQNSVLSDTKLQWSNRYDGHQIDLLGGFRFINESYNLTRQSGYNTGNDKTPKIDGTETKQIAGSQENWATLTWYAQAKYNWGNRYYLQADLAMDTNSQFGRDAKSGIKLGGVAWGIFPSIQAGWLISNEKWFDVQGIDYLKVTAGYDVSGNDALPYDASRSYFSSKLLNGEIPGLSINNIGNSELQWETTRRFNFGIDARMWNNRLAVGIHYFRSKTDNLLTLRSLSFLSGIDSHWSNSGSLKNRGYDFTLSGHVISGNKWNWSIGGSMGHYVNELTSLPDGDHEDHQILGATIRSQVGEPINSFFGLQTAKTKNGTIVYATTEEAVADGLRNANGVAFQGGDVKYVDQNGDGIINDDDRVFLGEANPDFYGNIWTRLSYKRLTLDVNFNYSVGGKIYNYNRQQLESGSRFMNQTTAILGRWGHEGQVTDIPRANYDDPVGNSAFSDRWIEDGSYLRLKNVTLSYQLPINSTYIQGITVWASATNLFTITRYLGLDPEVSMSNSVLAQGIDRGYLTSGRTFNLGLKINL